MANKLPTISGNQLIKLLKKDGFVEKRKAKHGVALAKTLPDGRKIVTYVPQKNDDLPDTTLGQILGMKQTRLERKGLERLIKKFGI